MITVRYPKTSEIACCLKNKFNERMQSAPKRIKFDMKTTNYDFLKGRKTWICFKDSNANKRNVEFAILSLVCMAARPQ